MFNFDDFLINTATIKRFTLITSNTGGTKKTFSAVDGLSNLPCSLQPISGKKAEFAAKLQMDVTHVAYFNQTLPLQNGDILNDQSFNYNIQSFETQGGVGAGNNDVFAVYLMRLVE